MSTRFSLSSVKNPIDLLSGDQKGNVPASVPASGREVSESSARR
jgi:hypothetical protein